MTNEIKEIIEALKPHSDIVKEYPLTLSIEEQKLLLDYITILQEENERLKEDEMIENLIKENQQLSKKINHLLNELKELKEEGK